MDNIPWPYIIILVTSLVTIAAIIIICNKTMVCNGFDEKKVCESECVYVHRIQNWLIFIVIFFCFVCIISLAMSGDGTAVELFSFASTVSSIILSVIAIFMSISGEKKVEITKEKMEIAISNLDKMVSNSKGNFDEIIGSLREVSTTMQRVEDNTKNIPQRNLESSEVSSDQRWRKDKMSEFDGED